MKAFISDQACLSWFSIIYLLIYLFIYLFIYIIVFFFSKNIFHIKHGFWQIGSSNKEQDFFASFAVEEIDQIRQDH